MEPSFLAALLTGFLLGLRHATDADHVAAVTAMMARHQTLGRSWILGAFWGLGHSLTIIVAGSAIILFRLRIPASVESTLEAAVGLMLLLLGGANLAGRNPALLGPAKHAHEHDHQDPEHRHDIIPLRRASGDARPATGGSPAVEIPGSKGHSHFHLHEISFSWTEKMAAVPIFRSALIGIVHGLAGSAALALLVLAAIPDPVTGILYLFIFSLGTMGGMTLLSALLEFSLLRLAGRWLNMDRWLTIATGLLSVALGAWKIGTATFP